MRKRVVTKGCTVDNIYLVHRWWEGIESRIKKRRHINILLEEFQKLDDSLKESAIYNTPILFYLNRSIIDNFDIACDIEDIDTLAYIGRHLNKVSSVYMNSEILDSSILILELLYWSEDLYIGEKSISDGIDYILGNYIPQLTLPDILRLELDNKDCIVMNAILEYYDKDEATEAFVYYLSDIVINNIESLLSSENLQTCNDIYSLNYDDVDNEYIKYDVYNIYSDVILDVKHFLKCLSNMCNLIKISIEDRDDFVEDFSRRLRGYRIRFADVIAEDMYKKLKEMVKND